MRSAGRAQGAGARRLRADGTGAGTPARRRRRGTPGPRGRGGGRRSTRGGRARPGVPLFPLHQDVFIVTQHTVI